MTLLIIVAVIAAVLGTVAWIYSSEVRSRTASGPSTQDDITDTSVKPPRPGTRAAVEGDPTRPGSRAARADDGKP